MVISTTPFRISFFGGGTDYPEYFSRHAGAVLGSAIDQVALISAHRLHPRMRESSIRVSYRTVECVDDLEEVAHAPFRECIRAAGIAAGIELTYAAQVPSSVGLGTSSSCVVGALNTLHALEGRSFDPLTLAYHAIDMERNVLGETVGCQDQVFAAVGGFNLIEFHDMWDVRVHPVALDAARLAELQAHLLLVFTGIRRRASEVARKQVCRVAQNKGILSEMRRMVDEGYDILTGQGSLDEFGALLNRAWELKSRLDQGVSSDSLNQLYRRGIEHGAIGGKLLGAGGGGFMLFCVPPERRAQLTRALADYDELAFNLNAPGSQILYAPATRAEPVNVRALSLRQAA